MAVWEQVLMGMGAFLILFLFWPGVKQVMQRSKQVENPDWQSALLPIGVVVLFVVLLIMLAKS
ncbi:MAG: hypothetical protein IIB73_08745 [Proteobacteria bacterium]|nr:hypothetical protein [Pseudomonadota bacterium]